MPMGRDIFFLTWIWLATASVPATTKLPQFCRKMRLRRQQRRGIPHTQWPLRYVRPMFCHGYWFRPPKRPALSRPSFRIKSRWLLSSLICRQRESVQVACFFSACLDTSTLVNHILIDDGRPDLIRYRSVAALWSDDGAILAFPLTSSPNWILLNSAKARKVMWCCYTYAICMMSEHLP